MKMNIAVIAGGDGSEAEVSLRSGEGVFSFLNKDKYHVYFVILKGKDWRVRVTSDNWCEIDKNDFSFTYDGDKICFDFAYIIIHGSPGENGILQGYLSLLRIPHSTCDVLPAAITFNKFVCNQFLKSLGINVAPSIAFRQDEKIDEETIIEKIGLPCFIKCTEGGSSLGCFKTKRKEDILTHIQSVFQYGNEVVCEKFIDGMELTCGMYQTQKGTVVFPITQVVPQNEFFDYGAKYKNQVEEITPAPIADGLAQQIRETTMRIYKILHCKGIIRIDYIVDKEGKVFLLEVNTTPGMTPTSFIPQQVKAAGLNISDVLDEIIEDSMTCIS